jgi:antagonist of KipI
MITVTRAPPYLTVQDDGRKRSRAAGVPRGGAMDRFALGGANAVVGNALNAAALEWGLGGGTLRFDAECTFAVSGAIAAVSLAGEPVAPFTTMRARSGDELIIHQIDSGRFLYVAFHGGVDVPIVLHSRSTYLPGGFGGHEGRLLRSGDVVRARASTSRPPEVGFHAPGELTPTYTAAVVHVVRGPQSHLFDDIAWEAFLATDFRVASASDRTGYRLEGTVVANSVPSLPSEVGCQGAIQIPGDGKPIVLMADAPTVGGYPKIAVVSESDLSIMAQRQPGDTVRFELFTIEQSQRAARRRASDLQTIRSLAESSVRRA